MTVRDDDLDPEIEAVVRQVRDALSDLETARIRLENLDIQALLDEPTVVDDAFMTSVANVPTSSVALRAYAERVRVGECGWSEIEYRAQPVPPEVSELKNSPRYIWQWSPVPPVERKPARRQADTVGPSDWPDDFDDYPTGRSWLE